MANANKYHGLARGPIDHAASSVINSISNGEITMGDVLITHSSLISGEVLPRVNHTTTSGAQEAYGIAVGGDADGIYGDGSSASDDTTKATTGAGQGVVVVTQGRCLARVSGAIGDIDIGDKLATSVIQGVLVLAIAGDYVIATALHGVANADTDMIAVDVQREGAVPA